MMRRRGLGRTGESLSVVGFGGIVVMDETREESARLVKQAIERGVNYFDVAPTYGNAEERLGPALEPYRESVFLACKTTQREKAKAAAELRRSLALLRTDHVDLYQMHGLTSVEEVEKACGPDGALEAFREARDNGQVRHIGFSAHSEEAALAAMERFDFATVLFPLNRYTWHRGKFGPRVVAEARRRGMGILALKCLARRALGKDEPRPWAKCWYAPVESYAEAVLNTRFTLSLPVTAAVTPGHEKLFLWACDAAEEFRSDDPEASEFVPAADENMGLIFSHG